MKFRPFGLHPAVIALAGTHFVVDGYGNILAPLLPLLISQLNLTLTAAGTLTMCFQLSTSVAQLGFGSIADRWRPRVLLLAGPLLSVLVLPLIGLASTPMTLAAVLIVGGLGGAAFHPPAAALVHRYSEANRGLAMSFHITSGTIAQAAAPLLFAPYVQLVGLRWTPLLALPALALLGGVLLRRIPPIDRLQERGVSSGLGALRPYAQPLSLLYFIVVLRTLTSLSYGTFLPVMLTNRGMSLAAAGMATSVYIASVGVGGFFGGPLADRFGPRRLIILSLVSAVPFLMVAPTLQGWPLIAMLSVGGFLLQSTLAVNLTFGQMIAPVSAATVSSLMMGFAWGMGGVMVPFVGMLADRFGIERTLIVMSSLPLAAAALALPLPGGKLPGAQARISEIVTSESPGTDVAQ
jgi:MFS transporter, FSR family, fosmidomycin resistance protein